MNSNSQKFSNSFILCHSFENQNKILPYNKYKSIKLSNKMDLKNRFYEHQNQKGNFKYLEKYVHRYFMSFYRNTKNDYNVRMIEDILNNEGTHLVAEFKDYLIMGDVTEFLQKSYNIQECKKFLPKIYEYYNSCSVIFPNYVTMHESKYIYKNIRKKQKVIDNQQEQEDKQEKIKKGDLKLEENDEFFSSKTFNSILDQTNTSNVKIFFGINDTKNVDANETPNNIVQKLEKAENEAFQRKMNLVKNKKSININEYSNTSNHVYNTMNTNNSSKVYMKNKISKEKNRNKIRNKGNVHYLSTQKKSTIKIHNNMNINSTNINSINCNSNKIRINTYAFKSKSKNKNENDSKKHIKSSTSITDTDNDTINKNNYITFYNNNFNHSKKINTRKLFIENSGLKSHQIYIRNRGNFSNKNMKNQCVNTIIPSKTIISNIFNNISSNSVIKQNSFNFINKKIINKNIKDENKNQFMNSPDFPVSPSSITIQANPFRKKFNCNLNVNIKESNSTRNIKNKNRNGINRNNNNRISNDRIIVNNIQDRIIRSDKNKTSLNYNNTISSTSVSKTSANKDKIKYIHRNSNFNFNKAQVNNKFKKNNNSNSTNKCTNFRTIVNDYRGNENLNYNNNGYNYNYKNENFNNNLNYIQKINSTSNIKKPINMNININMNNTSKNKIYFNDGSYNKIYYTNPYNTNETETIRDTSKHRVYHFPSKKIPEKNEQKIIFNDLYNRNYTNINTNANYNLNTLSNDKNILDSLIYSPFNYDARIDEISAGIKNGVILEELNKKKKIIFPMNKEINNINNINININGYNSPGGYLTSRMSKKKYKFVQNNNNEEEINFMKTKIKKIQNSLVTKNESNPIKIRRMGDNVKSNKNSENQRIMGYNHSRKKK